MDDANFGPNQLRLKLLGTLIVEVDNQPVQLRSQKALALLCFVAIENREITRQFLAGLLWPETTEATARSNLRTQDSFSS